MNSKRASACVQKSPSSALVPRYRSNLIGTAALADEKSPGLENPTSVQKVGPTNKLQRATPPTLLPPQKPKPGRQAQVFRNDALPQRSAVCLLGCHR